jgi:hypothetical protein
VNHVGAIDFMARQIKELLRDLGDTLVPYFSLLKGIAVICDEIPG